MHFSSLESGQKVAVIELRGSGRGRSVDLDNQEMGIVWTTIISAVASGVSAAAKGISRAVKKKRAAKKEREESERAAQQQAQELAKKKKTTIGLAVVGGILALGAGAIMLTGRE